MAGLNLQLPFFEVTLTVNAWKTAAAIKAPTNQMLRVKGAKLATDGIAGDAQPLLFRLARITPGNGTATSATPQKTNDAMTATPQSTGRINFTAEPTDDGTAPYTYADAFHPQGGLAEPMEFDEVYVKEGKELALQIKVPSGGTAVKVTGHLKYEE